MTAKICKRALAAALILAAGSLHSSVAAAQEIVRITPVPPGDPERFLQLLRAGKPEEALDSILESSPLYARKIGARETVLGQMKVAIEGYGPVTGYEHLGTQALGTMVRRERYLVQHRDWVVRWEFHLVFTAAGWRVGHFSFNDEVKTWLPDSQ